MTNHTLNTDYSQNRQYLVKNNGRRSSDFVERRKEERRKSDKPQKQRNFQGAFQVENEFYEMENKWLKQPKVMPKQSIQAYQQTIKTHANWQCPAVQQLRKI